MKPVGNNVVVEPRPRETVLKSGIIIPETAENPNTEWGVVVHGNDSVAKGSEVLYFGKNCFSEDDKKLVHTKKILICDDGVLFGNILLRPETVNQTAKAGIQIPDAAKRLNNKGTVVSVGRDVEEVSVDDEVVCRDGSLTQVSFGGKDYVIVNEKNVLYVRN